MKKAPKPKKVYGPYEILLIDPPWRYKNEKDHQPKLGGMTYKTMTQDELKALKVGALGSKNSALFCWATMPKLAEALELIEAYGYTYTTCAFTWVKLNPTGRVIEVTGKILTSLFALLGMKKLSKKILILVGGFYSGLGSWSNGNAELVLFAKRGAPKRIRKDVKQIVFAPRGSVHSRKPAEVHERIVELVGDLPRVELFARREVPGWVCIGDDVTGRDIKEDIELLLKEAGQS